jgi:hypothetical protein
MVMQTPSECPKCHKCNEIVATETITRTDKTTFQMTACYACIDDEIDRHHPIWDSAEDDDEPRKTGKPCFHCGEPCEEGDWSGFCSVGCELAYGACPKCGAPQPGSGTCSPAASRN